MRSPKQPGALFREDHAVSNVWRLATSFATITSPTASRSSWASSRSKSVLKLSNRLAAPHAADAATWLRGDCARPRPSWATAPSCSRRSAARDTGCRAGRIVEDPRLGAGGQSGRAHRPLARLGHLRSWTITLSAADWPRSSWKRARFGRRHAVGGEENRLVATKRAAALQLPVQAVVHPEVGHSPADGRRVLIHNRLVGRPIVGGG
jgi:hypothetical protein